MKSLSTPPSELGNGWVGFSAADWKPVTSARNFLLVEISSLFLSAGNRLLRRRHCWGTLDLRPPGESGCGRFPCTFPADQGFRAQRRVRDRLPPPPFSLLLQRLPERFQRWTQKNTRFRGAVAQGDGEFRAQMTPRRPSISVAKLSGSLSLSIRR